MGIGDGGGELLRGFVASGCTGSSASGCQPTQIKIGCLFYAFIYIDILDISH